MCEDEVAGEANIAFLESILVLDNLYRWAAERHDKRLAGPSPDLVAFTGDNPKVACCPDVSVGDFVNPRAGGIVILPTHMADLLWSSNGEDLELQAA